MTQTTLNGVIVGLQGENINLGYCTYKDSGETYVGLLTGNWKVSIVQGFF